MRYVRIPKSRIKEWLNALEATKEFAEKLHEALGPVTVLLHGSFARGDFNLWSDIDLIVLSKRFENIRPLDRFNLLPEMPPRVEPILLTREEFLKLVEKPAWRQALARGVVVVIDDYNIARVLNDLEVKVLSLKELYKEIKGLDL
ncbi:MAG: nucleotidyltransferase domain-containing protein [Desulfurococcales archaeon]|nr:nucleotidyltransferase domain-containing protein [Desulfurococcales archaeon]